MADLIERDELRKDFCNMCEAMQPEMIDCTKKGCMSMQIIDEQPAVNRWIPCSERLPESRIGVIFTVDRGHSFVCVGYRINSERDGLKLQRWFDKLSGLNFSDYDVKAWMPMPDAYEPPESEVQDET